MLGSVAELGFRAWFGWSRLGVMCRQEEREDLGRTVGKERGHSLPGICRATLTAPAVCPEPKG